MARWPAIGGRSTPDAFPDTEPIDVSQDERVRLRFANATTKFHPMHVHGQTFALGQKGARKDTVVVRPKQVVEVDLEAANPGDWATHSHNIYHAEAGMMTVLRVQPLGHRRRRPYLQRNSTEPALCLHRKARGWTHQSHPKEAAMRVPWTVNITPAERIARVVLGALAAITGVILLVGATTGLAAALEILLVLAGLDLVVTGALGHCPLYAKLGHVPASLKGRTS